MTGAGLLVLIGLPALAGLIGYLAPKKYWQAPAGFLLLSTGGCAFISAFYFIGLARGRLPQISYALGKAWELGSWQGKVIFQTRTLGMGMALLAALIGFFIFIWALGYYKVCGQECPHPEPDRPHPEPDRPRHEAAAKKFFANAGWALALSFGVFFSDHLVALAVFWGLLCVPLFLMLASGPAPAHDAAKKALLIIFATDTLLLLGIAMVFSISGGLRISALHLDTRGPAAICAYFLIASAGFAKAGIIPFHSWIPDAGEHCPVPAVALVPAALDKLLGIYLLAIASTEIFKITAPVQAALLVIGALTALFGVLAALVQRHFQKLLAYHAISQAGYMLIGIGTATPLGIAAAIFHMLNNIIYKPLLFLASGEIEKRTGSRRLDQIRGQHKILPASFASFVIAALAISGIPPLNGFFSKWMIFQGIIACAGQFPRLWVFILLAAMSASALTLASFLKLIASVYLGPEAEGLPGPDQSAGKILMQGPMAAMALACAALGIFGYPLALRGLLEPMLGTRLGMIGFWQPLPATLLLLLGLALGGAFYLLASRIKVREDDRYLLGEESEGMGYSAADFYRTLETDRAWLGRAYQALERGRLDLYDLGRRATFYFSDLARKLHNGSLPGYIAWSIFGMAVLLWVFMQWG